MIAIQKLLTKISILGATVFVLSGCLLSAQFIFTILRAGPYYYNTTTNFDAVHVDLSENSDFDEHKDEIDRIESIRFGGRVTNNSGVADVISMYISPFSYANYAALEAGHANGDVYSVLSNMPVPASTSEVTVTAEDTDPYLNSNEADFNNIRALVKTGMFYSYAVGGGPNFDLVFRDCVYYIAFSASK